MDLRKFGEEVGKGGEKIIVEIGSGYDPHPFTFKGRKNFVMVIERESLTEISLKAMKACSGFEIIMDDLSEDERLITKEMRAKLGSFISGSSDAVSITEDVDEDSIIRKAKDAEIVFVEANVREVELSGVDEVHLHYVLPDTNIYKTKEDREGMLEICAGWLKPGGELFVSGTHGNAEKEEKKFEKAADDWYNEMKKFLKSIGFGHIKDEDGPLTVWEMKHYLVHTKQGGKVPINLFTRGIVATKGGRNETD